MAGILARKTYSGGEEGGIPHVLKVSSGRSAVLRPILSELLTALTLQKRVTFPPPPKETKESKGGKKRGAAAAGIQGITEVERPVSRVKLPASLEPASAPERGEGKEEKKEREEEEREAEESKEFEDTLYAALEATKEEEEKEGKEEEIEEEELKGRRESKRGEDSSVQTLRTISSLHHISMTLLAESILRRWRHERRMTFVSSITKN